jgi:hypothetical protein
VTEEYTYRVKNKGTKFESLLINTKATIYIIDKNELKKKDPNFFITTKGSTS